MKTNTERTVRHRKPDGSYETCPVDKIPLNPIVCPVLDDKILPRIKKVYEVIKDVLAETTDIKSLEQFEIAFMRAYKPEDELEMQEIVIDAYRNCIGCFRTDSPKDFVNLYKYIMRYVVDWFTPEEKEREDIKKIIEIYEGCKERYYKNKKAN